MTIILTDLGEASVPAARVEGESLWLSARDAERVTGWSLKPEGVCKGDVCVPLPPARAGALTRDGAINVAELWRRLGMAVAHDAAGETWALGASASDMASRLSTLEAPDFALPDLSGRMHSLSEHRGRKVLLVSWASW